MQRIGCLVQLVKWRNYIRLFSLLDLTVEHCLRLLYEVYHEGSTDFQRMPKRKEEIKLARAVVP
jgi:hypothetical protein